MPSILSIPYRDADILQIQLAKKGLVIDSRVVGLDKFGWKYECEIHGRTLSITRIRKGVYFGHWDSDRQLGRFLRFRLYDPAIESVPESFASSKPYRYHGLEFEEAPATIREVVVDSSVKVIRESAFHRCARLEKCTMGDNVEEIEARAFCRCHSLKKIRLSKGLRYIDGFCAFEFCTTLKGIFIPPNVECAGNKTFNYCYQMRMLVLPRDSVIQSRYTSIPRSQRRQHLKYFDEEIFRVNGYKLQHTHQLLTRICADPDVKAQQIQTYVQKHGTDDFFKTDENHGLTPLHIITSINTLANSNAIFACYEANPSALFIPDGEGSTPIDALLKNSNVDALAIIIEDLCVQKLQANTKEF